MFAQNIMKKYNCTKQQAKDFLTGKIDEKDLTKPVKKSHKVKDSGS